jgi:hypothetical protein
MDKKTIFKIVKTGKTSDHIDFVGYGNMEVIL